MISQEQYLKHAIDKNYWGMTNKSNVEIMRELQNRLVCRRCETLIPRHLGRNRGKCPKCGWEGETITLDAMLTQKLYK